MHKIPGDLKQILDTNAKMQACWAKITPLAKNEWICWIISPKKAETRVVRLNRAREEILDGKKRPCCWAGCPHR